MKRTNVILAASLLVFATFLTSCQKTEETSPLVATSIEDDEVTAIYDDVLNEVDELTSTGIQKSSAEFVMTTGSGVRDIETTFSGDTMIKTITFTNFVNGVSENGHIKNGVMVIKIVGAPNQVKFERTITFQNFFVDDIQIEGINQITKTEEHQFTNVLTNGKLTFPDETTFTREFTHTRTWVSGFDTPATRLDDIFTIEGSANGTNRKGYTYTHTIQNALVVKNSCRWIIEGTVEQTFGDKTAVLDYGMGECDDKATITIDGKAQEITLKGKR